MSTGGTGQDQKPLVIQEAPGAWIDRLLKALVIVSIIGATIFVGTLKKSGKLSDEDAANAVQMIKTYGPMLMAKAPDGTAQTTSVVETSTVVTKPKPNMTAEADRGFSPEDLDKWLPLIQKGGELLKVIFNPPAPSPTPIPGPTPSEQALLDQIAQLQKLVDSVLKPPAPTPVPVPVPTPIPAPDGTAKINVFDEQDKPITAATIEAGTLFRVASTIAPGNAGWSVSRNGDVKLITLANNEGFVCYLSPGAWVEYHLTDFTTRKQSVLRITCNQGPQPPPGPGPIPAPIPTVDIKPTPKPATDLRVFVVYESSQNHTAKQDVILSSVVSGKINDALNARCSKGSDGRANWRRWDKDIVYDSSSPMGSLFSSVVEAAKSKGLPALVVACGNDSTVYPISPDATEDAVISVLNCGGAN